MTALIQEDEEISAHSDASCRSGLDRLVDADHIILAGTGDFSILADLLSDVRGVERVASAQYCVEVDAVRGREILPQLVELCYLGGVMLNLVVFDARPTR